MQFTQITAILTIAAGASAAVVARGGSAPSVPVCAEPPSGKCDVKAADKCKAGGGTAYTCSTGPGINILTCSPISVLNGVDVTATLVDLLDLVLGDVTLPILSS